MASAFRGVLDFMSRMGLYDVVLPFLMIFAIVFAALEKSKIFGTAKDEDDRVITKKNLNAIVAMVIAFFVVASAKAVGIITKVSVGVVFLFLFGIFFMMFAGLFAKEEKHGFFLKKGWLTFLMVAGLIIVAVIFLDALGWLKLVRNYLGGFWTSDAVAGGVYFVIVIGGILFTTSTKLGKGKKKDEDEEDD